MQGRVFNAHWMTYFDEASFEFIVESLGESISTSDLIHSVVVKSTIEWQGSATYRDDIDISVSVSRVGNSSFDLTFGATVGSQLVCRATNTYVNLDPSTGRSSPLRSDLRARLEAMSGASVHEAPGDSRL